jgi:hypothetical protein
VRIKRNFVIAAASGVLLASCAGQPETYTPTNAAPVTMPKGTLTGGASVGDASALANAVMTGLASGEDNKIFTAAGHFSCAQTGPSNKTDPTNPNVALIPTAASARDDRSAPCSMNVRCDLFDFAFDPRWNAGQKLSTACRPTEQKHAASDDPASRDTHGDPGPVRTQLDHQRGHQRNHYRNACDQSRINYECG